MSRDPRNTDLPPELRAMKAAMDMVFGAIAAPQVYPSERDRSAEKATTFSGAAAPAATSDGDGVVERGPVRSAKAECHTPGPWRVVAGMLTVEAENRQRGRWYDIVTVHGAFEEGEAEANARLIAAAPELLEALQAAEALRPRLLKDFGYVPEYVLEFCNKARAVLYKVRP